MIEQAMQAPEVVTISWTTVAGIITPIVAGGVGAAQMLIKRADKDRDELMRRMDGDRADSTEDRRALRESLDALRKAVDASSASRHTEDDRSAQIVQTQQRIVWAQERILALLERDLGLPSSKQQAEHRA